MDYRALINSLDTVDTAQAYTLGETMLVPANIWVNYAPSDAVLAAETQVGPALMQYVFNDEASTGFAQGEVVRNDTDYAYGHGIRCTTTGLAPELVYGVAQWAIAAGSYGWILKEGIGLVLADGNVTAGSRIVTDTAADVTDATDNADATVDNEAFAIGVAHATDAGATLVRARVCCKG